MTSDEAAFLAAIKAAPFDEAPRKIFADWLDDHERPEEAERHRQWTLLTAKAEEVASEVGIDPLTVLAVISALLPIVQACLSTPESAERYFRQDTRATRRAIRRACDSAWRQRHKCNAPKRLVLAMQHRLATGDSSLYKAMYES